MQQVKKNNCSNIKNEFKNRMQIFNFNLTDNKANIKFALDIIFNLAIPHELVFNNIADGLIFKPYGDLMLIFKKIWFGSLAISTTETINDWEHSN